MDKYAAELIHAHEGSLELEQLLEDHMYEPLPVGLKSTNGAVEHLGAGVFLEIDTLAIDRDSRRGRPKTITRTDLRDVARRAVKELDTIGNAAVIGHPGIGKTRGCLTYALQILLSRGETVLRVGYKENVVYAFLPNMDGNYEVWRNYAEFWHMTRITHQHSAYALIDPPERTEYSDCASCKMLKFVTNDVKRHYRNFYKDGTEMFVAMPTPDEMVAMTEELWDEDETPIRYGNARLEEIRDIEAKKEEVRDRCSLVGCSLREVFSGYNFLRGVREIVADANTVEAKERIDDIANLRFDRSVVMYDDRASSDRSLLYNVDPFSSRRHRAPIIRPKPLVKYLWKEYAERKDVRSALAHEAFSALLERGGTLDDTAFPPRKLLRADGAYIHRVSSRDQTFVVTPPHCPILDFATSPYEWYDAKVGEGKPIVKAGDFATLILGLGLAHKVNGELVMKKEHEEAKISLTMLRDAKSQTNKMYQWNAWRGPDHKDMDAGALKKFFDEYVDVKVLDTTNWESIDFES